MLSNHDKLIKQEKQEKNPNTINKIITITKLIFK